MPRQLSARALGRSLPDKNALPLWLSEFVISVTPRSRRIIRSYGAFSQTYARPLAYFSNHSSSVLALNSRCCNSPH